MTCEYRQRDPDLAVAQPFAGDLRMYPRRQHVGRVSMTQIVETQVGEGRSADGLDPLMRDEGWLHPGAVCLPDDEVIVRHANAEP